MAGKFRNGSTRINSCLVALLTTVTLGAQPYAYVGNFGSVSVLNMATNTVTASIFGIASSGIAVTPDGSTVYVSSSNYNNVAAISTSNNTIVATIPVGLTPRGLAVSPNGAVVYVVNYSSSTVSVISPTTNTVTATIAVGIRPNAVAFSPDSTRAYVTNYVSNSISVIDTSANAVINTFPTSGYPNGVAVTPDGTRLYVANQGTNMVTVHSNSGGIVTTISGFLSPDAVAIANGKAYIANANGNSVSIVDTTSNSVVGTIPTGIMPTGVAITTDGTQALVANQYSNSVSKVSTSTNTLTGTVGNVGIYPTVVAMQPASTGGGGACTVTAALAPGNSLSFGSGGGTATINITASAQNCTWSVVGSGFAALTPSTTAGNGTVTVSAGANAGTASLSEAFTVAGQPFTVTEAGIACTYSASITAGSLVFGATGGTATISVTTPAGCPWSASGPSFVTLTPSTTSGSGIVGVSVGANNTGVSLSGTITAAGVQFRTTEAGVPCTATLSGNTSLPSSAGTGSVTVTMASGCTWGATAVDSWLTVTSIGAGSGSGSVAYSYLANNSTATRAGSMTIAGQNFGVNQAAVGFTTIRVNAGSATAMVDSTGNTWAADPGRNYSVTMATITDAIDTVPTLYQKAAYAGGAGLSYSYTVPNGTFTVKLHFAETYETMSNRRLMNVTINGQVVSANLDVLAQAGAANTAYVASFSTNVTNGQITVTVAPSSAGCSAMLSGLEIQ